MSYSDVDSRLVEMQFDAKDFDKGIKKSQKNFEDFKKSLNFDDASKQLSKISEAMSPANNAILSLASNVQKLTNEFLGIGKLSTYIAKKIQSAWRGALNEIERFGKSMTAVQIDVGKEKYEKLLRSVQTIKNATGDTEEVVYGVMDTLNKYTDETSYDFADMAQNIGKFTTAGIKLGDAEKEMEGIANWAALAGQGVNEAQRAMYNISQAMSAGYMLKIDYKSIQNANMDIRDFRKEALEAAVAMGTLKKAKDGVYKTVKGNKEVNLDNFVETLQFKWFDKKTMEAVFKTFGDNTQGIGEKAYKAAQRCVTLSDVLNAWKDMLSTGWMKSYEHVFGQLSDAMGLFSGLCNKVSEDLAKLVNIRNGILEHWSLGGGRNALWGALFGELETPDGEKLFKGAYGFLDALRDIGEAIRQAFWDFVGEFIDPANKSLFNSDKEGQGIAFLSAKLTDLTMKFQEFTGKIKDFLFTADDDSTETRMDRIKNVAKAVFSAITLVVNVISGIGGFIGKILQQLHPAISAVEQLIDFIAQMFTGAVVKGAKSNAIGNFFTTLAEILRPVTTVINFVVRALASLIANIIATAKNSGVLTTLGNIFKYLSAQLSNIVVKVLNSGVMQSIFGWIQNAITKIPELASKIKAFADVLVTNFRNSKAGKGISDFFKNTFNSKNIKGFLTNLKTTLSKLTKKIPELFGSLFGGISSNLGDAFSKIFGISTASAEGVDVTEKLAESIATPIENIGKGNVINDALDRASPGIFEKLKTKFKSIWEKISGFFTTLANSEGIQKIKTFFEGTNFKELLSGATGILKWLAIFRTGSGLVSIGKGAKSLGKGLKVIGKNFKNLNFTDMFKNMFNISNIINSNNNTKSVNFSKFGNQILQLSIAIGILAYSASMIAKMNDGDLLKAGKSIGIIIAALIAAGFMAKKFAGNGASIMSLAAGVLLLMIPMKILKKESWDDVLNSAGKLFLVIAALTLASAIAGNVNMKGFVGLALAVNLLMIPLKILSNMSIMGSGPDMAGGLLKAILALETLILSMAIAARIADGNKMKGMLSLGLALTLMMIPLKVIANMSFGNAVQGIVSLLAIMAGITAMVKLTKGAEMTKLAGLVGALTALSVVALIIGNTTSWDKALVGFGSIVALMLAMSLIMKQAGKMDASKLKQVKAIFLSFSLLVGIVAGAIVLMDQLKVDWKLVASFLGGLTALVAVLGIILPILGKMSPKSVVVSMLALAGAVVAIMGAVALMIPVVLGSVGNAMTKLSVKLKSMGMLLRDFFGTMDSISDTAVDHTLRIFTKLFDLIKSFAGFGDYEVHIRSAMSQMNSLGAGIDALLVNEKDYPNNFEDTKTYKILNKVLEMSPAFTSFSVGSLPEELLYLGVGMMLFDESSKRITSTENKALELLQGIFGQADNIEKFTKLPLSTFSGQMSALGGAMSLYAQGASEITGLPTDNGDIPDISNSVKILKAICAAISGEDGSEAFKIPDNMPDSFSLGLFAGQLESLGRALSTFASSAKEMETDTSKAIALLEFLAEIGGYVTPENLDVVNAFDEVGHAEANGKGGKLNQFALDIGALGEALGTFATNIKGSSSDFEEGLSILGRMKELNHKLTADNIRFAKVFDNAGIHKSALSVFSDDIGALGHSIASFAKNVILKDGTKVDFDYALQALDFLANLQNRLPDMGGLHQLLYGEKETLGKLSDDVILIGNGLSSFSQSITGASEDGSAFNMKAVTEAVDFLSSLINVIGMLNTTVIPTDNMWADDYGDVITNFANLLAILNGDFGNESMIEDLASFAQRMTTAFNEIGGIDAQAISVFSDLAKGLATLITLDVSGEYRYPGKMISEGIAIGIEEGRSRVVNAIVSVVSAAIQAGKDTANIASPSKVFEEMGQFMDAGLVKGLLNDKDDVEKASGIMTGSAIDKATSLMALISQAMADEVDYSPTITPVLDLSQITAAGSTLDSFFDNYSLNLMSSLKRASASVDNSPVQVVVQNPTDLTGLNEALMQVQTELVELQTAMTNMKIVLNNGVIAGGVTDDVDNNLGRKNLYASRRN